MTGTGTVALPSRTVDLGGPVHYVEGGSGAPVVLVHGLGGSHVNWLAVAPRLAERYRIFALDLAGFGRTPPAGRSSRVEDNRDLLDRFLRTVVGEPAVLIGNSMGGLISILQAAAAPTTVRELILVDPAQPRPRGQMFDPKLVATLAFSAFPLVGPWLMSQRKARLGAEGFVREVLGLCCVDLARVPAPILEAHIEIARERLETAPWSNAAFNEALLSLMAIVMRPARYRELVGRVRARALLIHGTEDRLVPVEASRELARLRPDWQLVELEDTGHTPQLERPERFLELVLPRLAAHATA